MNRRIAFVIAAAAILAACADDPIASPGNQAAPSRPITPPMPDEGGPCNGTDCP